MRTSRLARRTATSSCSTAQWRQLAWQIAQVEVETDRRRLALVEADPQVRGSRELRERQAAAHRKETQRQEAKQFDETAILGYVRRQKVLA